MLSPVSPPILLSLTGTAAPALTDDLLEEILLRVTSPADLARAATACLTFRRLTADPTFLRRYRSRHPPLLLGFVSGGFRFHPAEAPHPSAPAARALAGAADFSFDQYLPRGRGRRWYLCDVRDGRVLLKNSPHEYLCLADLAACDPLSRRYLLLPPIPDGLLATAEVKEQNLVSFEAFLLPSGGEEDETSFRVICQTFCVQKVVAFVFSSDSGCWSAGTSISWDDPSTSGIPYYHSVPLWPGQHYAYGCFYWKVGPMKILLKLDVNRMEFSIVGHPPVHVERDVVIVEAGEGRLGVFCRIKAYLYYAIRQNEGETTNEWQLEKLVPLPDHYGYEIVAAPERYISIIGFPKISNTVPRVCYSLEIKTLKIETVSQEGIRSMFVKLYFGFPPSMSPRRI